MIHILKRPRWHLPESAATPESMYQNRRTFLKAMGIGGLALGGLGCGPSNPGDGGVYARADDTKPPRGLPPYGRNSTYADAGRSMSQENLVTTYNNFYEFSLSKSGPARIAKGFQLDPYTLEIDGLVDRPMKLDLDQVEALGYEERVYRFRCVEAWAMTVPWLGVPLRKVLEHVGVKPEARFVAFKSFHDPERAPGQRQKSYDWPYHEGLRIDETMNDLAFIATGLYGKALLPQSGTPLRIVLPWKYGYKGPKSVVRMTLLDRQPGTFWNKANAREYKFYSNVDPKVPHPRWSQAMERYLGENLKNKPTQWYNGYGQEVAHLYADMPRVLS